MYPLRSSDAHPLLADTLNPRVYHNDLALRPSLSGVAQGFPLPYAVSQIDPSTFVYTHTPAQSATFTRLTGFDTSLPSVTSFANTVPVRCPCCLTWVDVPWLTAPVPSRLATVGTQGESLLQAKVGTGYAQAGFEATCLKCNMVFGRKELNLRKFANEIGRVRRELGLGRRGLLL